MKRLVVALSIILCISITFAHPGNTDAYGGHRNHSTGGYHYHHGYSAHQHYGGVCPYDEPIIYEESTPVLSDKPSMRERMFAAAGMELPDTQEDASYSESYISYLKKSKDDLQQENRELEEIIQVQTSETAALEDKITTLEYALCGESVALLGSVYACRKLKNKRTKKR